MKQATTEDEEEWSWVQRMMLGEINGDPPLIFHLGGRHKGDGEYKYFLTGSGASALIDYLELKDSRKNAGVAMKWAIASFLLAFIVGGFQIWSTYLTDRSIQIATEPQIDFYIQLEDPNQENEYSFGIENNGVTPIVNISASYSISNIYKETCLSGEGCSGSGVSSLMFLNDSRPHHILPTLKPSEIKTVNFSGGVMREEVSKYLNVVSIAINYERATDRKKYVVPLTYFFWQGNIFTLDEAKNIRELEPFVTSFRKFEGGCIGCRKYWRHGYQYVSN